MPVSPARAAAFDILLRVERSDAYASELLHSSQYEKLSHEDHGLATEIVMGVLRWRSVLDREIFKASSQPLEKLDLEVLTALRIAAYQMEFLTRVPARAAVNESVELIKRAHKRSAVPFGNAVLRKLAAVQLTPRQARDAGNARSLAEAFAHPLWLVERWVGQFGLDTTKQICKQSQNVPQTALRFSHPTVEADLKQQGIGLAPGALLHSARLVESGDITQSKAFRSGRVSIQDEASQLVALLVGSGTNILDCCAAPGGKTRVIAEQNPSASVTAVELHPHRVRLLQKLVPAKNVQVVTQDVREFASDKRFDRVLTDVPCSGTGTLSRNPEIKWRLKAEDLVELASQQLAILQSAMHHVVTGGRLVYSTCSLEPEENSVVVEKALAADSSFQLVNCRSELEALSREGELQWSDLDSLVSGPYLRTIPGVHPCDGFFAAILQKN